MKKIIASTFLLAACTSSAMAIVNTDLVPDEPREKTLREYMCDVAQILYVSKDSQHDRINLYHCAVGTTTEAPCSTLYNGWSAFSTLSSENGTIRQLEIAIERHCPNELRLIENTEPQDLFLPPQVPLPALAPR
jgi:hypothetical protein